MSSLETSVTLDDVFAVVVAKRVPLAPELAGYLTLEVADGADAGGGDVDPKTVYISEEGTVALVQPKRESPAGDAEASVRGILRELLDASGSATPALTAAAKRKPGTGLPSLVEELEAALIPVNRAAGRRALARLAREVKRVMLGVGRNASAPPIGLSRPPPRRDEDKPRPPSAPKVAARRPPPVPKAAARAPAPALSPLKPIVDTRRGPAFVGEDEASTARRPNQLAELAAAMTSSEPEPRPAPRAPIPMGLTPPPLPNAAPAPAEPLSPPVLSPAPVPVAPLPLPLPSPSPSPSTRLRARTGPLPPPPASKSAPPVAPPPPRRDGAPSGVAEIRPEAGGEKLFAGDEVDDLLATFEVSGGAAGGSETSVRNELKAIAGLGPTPPPPDAQTLAELTKDIGKDLPKKIAPPAESDGVEALLALADASGPLAPPLPPAGFPGRSEAQTAPPPPGVLARAPMPGAPKLPDIPPDSAPVSPLVPSAPAAAAMPQVGSPGPAFGAGEPAYAAPVAPTVGAPVDTTTGRRQRAESGAVASTGKRAASRRSGAQRPPRAPRTGLAMLVITLVVLFAGGVAIYTWRPAFFTGRRPRPAPSAAPSVTAAPPPAPRCKVALVVTDVPANAEILLRMGQSPLDVERMPVGTRLEFVATAEGYAPKRAIVRAESTWDKGPDGKPRVDVPIQLDPSKAKPGTVDPWPAAEPGSQVGGSGSPGTVHVVANVRGAEVWLLAGLGPEARIEQLKCDSDIDVLLAGPPSLRKRLHVGAQDIQAAQADPEGNKVVSVTAK